MGSKSWKEETTGAGEDGYGGRRAYARILEVSPVCKAELRVGSRRSGRME